jgi:hypothetical protein
MTPTLDRPRARAWAPLLLALTTAACETGGVGDPCVPEDEYFDAFSGFSLDEVNVESRSYQCETRVCLVNGFQGRVSCPYGTNGSSGDLATAATVDHGQACALPGGAGQVRVPVRPWRLERSAEARVYCSCRCDGADPGARYCECPDGFACTDVGVPIEDGRAQQQLAGSYCVRTGSSDARSRVDSLECTPDGPGSGDDGICGPVPAEIAAAPTTGTGPTPEP